MVVLPLVPVTPKVIRSSAGLPSTQAATEPRMARGSSATMTGVVLPAPISSAPRASVRTAVAPRPTASAANSAPCARAPGRATNRSPSWTTRLSEATQVTAASAA